MSPPQHYKSSLMFSLPLFKIIPQGEEMIPAVLRFANKLANEPLKKW